MIIRKLKKADSRAQLSRVYEKSWKYAYRGIIPQTYLDGIPGRRWASHPDTEGMNTLVLVDGKEIVGTSSYCKYRFEKAEGVGEIVSLYLLPDYMGRGLGVDLLGTAVTELSRMGFESVWLWVLEENQTARRFYERNGFSCSNVFLDDVIGGRALREVQYRKELRLELPGKTLK